MTRRRPLPSVPEHNLDDEGITVAEAAHIIGCDETTVRALVRCRQLEGWRVGKHRGGKPPTALRVSRGSCFEYRSRWDAGEGDPQQATKPRRPRGQQSAVLQETIAALRKHGFRI